MSSGLPIQILGSGVYLPDEQVTNEFFTRYLDTNDEWIVSRTGIRQRRRAAAGESTSVLAANAARLALDNAKLDASDIDLIVCATATADYPFPSAASIVQGEIGASSAAAFDIGAACAGSVYAVAVASSLLHSRAHRRALVIGAETLSRYLDYEDRGTAILLGDGAGALVLTAEPAGGSAILHWELGCDGTRTKDIWVPAGGSRLPASATTVAERLHFMKMRGREVYKFAVTKMQDLVDRALSATGLRADQLKLVIPHQSNLRIIESVRERLNLPVEKVTVNIDRYGNTSAASVIIGLDEARRNGQLTTGDHVLLVALGSGLVWGAMVIRL